MKQSLIIRALVSVAILGVIAAAATVAVKLNLVPIAGDAPAGPPPKDELELSDLNAGETIGTWRGLTEKGDKQNKPFLSKFESTVAIVCDPDADGPQPAAPLPPPNLPASQRSGGSFLRKDPPRDADHPHSAVGQSKILVQLFLKYANDGGMTGQEKAQAMLDFFTTAVHTTGCLWQTQDPGLIHKDANGTMVQDPPRTRTWTIEPQPDPGLGEGQVGKSLHFRVSSLVGGSTNTPATPIVNDIIMMKRGPSLNIVMMTSPGAETSDQAAQNTQEATNMATKADTKVANGSNGT